MNRRRPRRAAVLVPLLLAAGCSSAVSGSPRATQLPSTTADDCADLVVIGARGSTQDPDLNAGVGTEVRVTSEQLVDLLHERTDVSVRLEAVRYDAAQTSGVAAYQEHTAEGSQMMATRLRSLEASCPQSRFALLGFSQGAQVVHGVATRMAPTLARRVSLVAMIADPLSNPADPITHWSYADEPTTGNGRLGSGPPIDADLRRAAISLCVEGDEICNDQGAPGGPPSAVHRHFYEKPSTARATAEQLDDVLQRNGI